MDKRIWSAAGLVCILLFLLAAPLTQASENRTTELESFEVKWRFGARSAAGANPLPNTGIGEPGDDDTPNRDGDGVVFQNPQRSKTIAADGGGGGFKRLRLIAAGLRLHMLKILRAWD
ncbi:MAG: hypothetical protein JSW67_07325 [Candidatus Latescibacterota bacterium]|nr:MAG: hypothetical protein JSW67_07325 [Candidatus Latescibacterota bacterium]